MSPVDHRQLGVDLFNQVWSLLETENRTAGQNEEMVHAVHASRYHWSQAEDPNPSQRAAIGEWQISRVYSVLGRGEPALFHAKRCLKLATQPGVEDWVEASACEGLARAAKTAGDMAAFEDWTQKAIDATAKISEEEKREIVESDIATL